MKNNKKIVFYTLYKEEKNEDLRLISQYDSLDDISKHLNIKKSTLKSQISQKQKVLNNYIIFKDYILENEI